MPGRIRYLPPTPLRDDSFSRKLQEEEERSRAPSVTSESDVDQTHPKQAHDPPAKTQQSLLEQQNDNEEDTFESLDRVAPLMFPRGYSETFTAENFTYAEVTVNEEDDDASEGSSGTESSEDAFIEVNHDDASVVSTLTLETALISKKGSKKKKKKKKDSTNKSKKKKKKTGLLSEEMIVEEEEGSRSEASEQTDKTGKTQNTAKSSKTKKSNALKSGSARNDEKAVVSIPLETKEIMELSNRLLALSNLDTISTQPVSARTTDAVASTGIGVKALKHQRDSQRAPEADTASEAAPPIPKKSEHSVELIPTDEHVVPSQTQGTKPGLLRKKSSEHTEDTANYNLDEASVKSGATKASAAKSKKPNVSPKSKKLQISSLSAASSDSKSNETHTKSTTLYPSLTSKPVMSAFPPPTSMPSSDMQQQSPFSHEPAKTREPSQQKPSSTSSLKEVEPKPTITPSLKTDTDKIAKPASMNRLQDHPSPMARLNTPNARIGRQSNTVPPSPRKQVSNQKNSILKKPPPAPSTKQGAVPTSVSGNLPRNSSGAKNGKNTNGTVARIPVTMNHSEGTAGNSSATPHRYSSVGTTPGAYHVHGSRMELASVHSQDLDDFSITGTSVASKQVKKKSRVPQSPISTKNLVVAAELSDDMEAQIEQEVRRRILASAVQADLISVASESSFKPPDTVTIGKPVTTVAELKDIHKHKGVKEKLFGDARRIVDMAASPESIRKRDYLQWDVKRNPATDQWIASVTTSQKAMEEGASIEMEMSKVSYAARTQNEAYETGLSNATPLMQRFDDNPICHCCKSKFAMFRRPSNCRNCGVCICSSCSSSWPSKMLPDTYLKKGEKSNATVCCACDWLARSFHNALISGNFALAVDLYATGNVNLRSPHCLGRKDEAMHPIHLATIGGNVRLVRWLVSERYCPLEVMDPKRRSKNEVVVPIVTSRGKSALEIALLHQRLDIVHYFVAEQGMSMFNLKNIGADVAISNLTTLLNMMPSTFFHGVQMQMTSAPPPPSARPGASRSPGTVKRRPSL